MALNILIFLSQSRSTSLGNEKTSLKKRERGKFGDKKKCLLLNCFIAACICKLCLSFFFVNLLTVNLFIFAFSELISPKEN